MAQKCIGFGTRTDLSAAIALPTVPSGTDFCVICAEGGAVRWRADGTDPTVDVGMLIASGATMSFAGPFDAIKFIEDDAAATPSISVSFFSFG